MVLRQGYVWPEPVDSRLCSSSVQRIGAHRRWFIDAPTLHQVENTAMSFALTGCSGIGKSKSIEKVLHQYPQCIQHKKFHDADPNCLAQTDCPYQGSPNSSASIFSRQLTIYWELQYLKWYGRGRMSIDEMMVHMAHVANLHALGVLVIDEIQHLNRAKTGPETLLNFWSLWSPPLVC